MLRSINPFTGKSIREWQESSEEDIRRILEESDSAFRFWSGVGASYRSKRLLKIADLLESSKNHLAVEMAAEMGKPVAQGQSEIEKCAWVCRYYAENGEDFLADEPMETEASESYVCYQPLGVILAVMPWNFPFWQLFRFAAPAVM
ncbi:MAG: aldehyde dehydrogenase family protein, partial [Candidatus Aegiribacteria sp.]|nr:aldehyde dehydrogenase family protein [Candidatus Aegiribacteria sp.]MBD3295545.1 aldehyde dehydrogenase family protein [Candidatus Fermentibacteria bacterium]